MTSIEQEYRATFIVIISLVIAMASASAIVVLLDNRWLIALALPFWVGTIFAIHKLYNYYQSKV